MDVVFLTPVAALVGLVAVLPLAAALLRERRAVRLRRTIGLGAPSLHARLPAALALAAVVGLLAVAAAQPAVRDRAPAATRRDAQAFFVFDISRSMLAARTGGATRLRRAVDFGVRLRLALPELPVGIVSLTDRVLPNLFPSPDMEDFAHVAARTLTIDNPPPTRIRDRSTDFSVLTELSTQNYFPPRAKRRVVVLLTDGESSPFDVPSEAQWLRRAHIGLVVVRFWRRDERIAGTTYRPDPQSAAVVDRFARAVSGGSSLREDELGATAAAVRRLVGKGAADPAARLEHVRPLGSFAVAAAAVPLAFLLLGRRLRLRRR
jgi:hypothetical protein